MYIFKKLHLNKIVNISRKSNNEIKLNNEKKIRFPSSQKIKKVDLLKIEPINMFKRKTYKKKNQIVNKELNAITKNIKNTNNAINNPNEFYMNFFNNIIQCSGYCDPEEDENIKGKIFSKINVSSGVKPKEINLSAGNDESKPQFFFNEKFLGKHIKTKEKSHV